MQLFTKIGLKYVSFFKEPLTLTKTGPLSKLVKVICWRNEEWSGKMHSILTSIDLPMKTRWKNIVH